MGFKKWWKKLDYWKKGAFIGLLIGLLKIPFLVLFGESIPAVLGDLIVIFPDQFLCNLLNLSDGEPCGFFVFFYGIIYNPIVYAIIGGILGFLFGLLKRK